MKGMLRRFATIKRDAINAEKRTVTLSLSSETPVQRWGDTEILLHGAENVDLARLNAVGAFHTDHDTTKPVAAITGARVNAARQLEVDLQFGRTAIAEDAFKNVVDGIYRGVSVGYAVHEWQIDSDKREYRATKWEPYEGSFTTIPADPSVGTGRDAAELELAWRSLSTRSTTGAPAPQESSMKITVRALLALCQAFPHLQTELEGRAQKGEDEATITTWAKAQPIGADEKARAEEMQKLREGARVATLHKELFILGRSHGVDFDAADLEKITDRAEGLELVLRKKAENQESKPGTPAGTVTVDEQDKRRAAAEDGLLAAFGIKGEKDLGMRRYSPCEIAREFAGAGANRLRKDDIAKFACRLELDTLGLRDANQSAANFSTVLSNVADKVVLNGYNQGNVTHPQWTSERMVDDFKQVQGAAVVAGLLKEQVAKGAPGEEINLLEKSYNAQLSLFLRVISFTYQDWRNDDLGLFADLLRQAGRLAAMTEDWQVYKTLLAQSWTNFTTTTAAFYDDTNDKPKFGGYEQTLSDLQDRKLTVGDESIPLMALAGFMLVPTRRRQAAMVVTGQANVGTLPQATPRTEAVRVISSPWLSNSALTGYSADDYFLGASNMDTVKAIRDRLSPQPSIMQVGAGATPDVKYLVMHAFKAVFASQDGMQKGDWA